MPDRDRAKGRPDYDLSWTVTFEAQGRRTRLSIDNHFPSTALRDAFVKLGMGEGWSQSLDKLATAWPSRDVRNPEDEPMTYVDGFIVPVPKKKLRRLPPHGTDGRQGWRDHGALELRECVADDVQVGKRTSFPRSVKLKRGEAVVYS